MPIVLMMLGAGALMGGAMMFQMNSAKYKFNSINYKERVKTDLQLEEIEKEYNLTYRSNFNAVNQRLESFERYGTTLLNGSERYMGKIALDKIKDIDLSKYTGDELTRVTELKKTYLKRIGRRGKLIDTETQNFVQPIERIE